MRPPYFNENAFSIYFDNRSSDSLSSKYEVETPETKFERELFELFQKGKEYLFKERPSLALNVFKELSLLFLRTIYPSLQSSPDINPFLRIPSDHRLFDLLMAKAGELLKMHPGRYHAFPAKMMQSQELPEEIEILLDSVNNNHYFFTRKQRDGLVIRAKEKAKSNDFEEAERLFERAYKVFQKDHNNSFLAKCIFHDLVVLKEKKLPADDKVSRKELLKTFDRPYDADPDRKDYNAYYHGWLTLIGLQLRAEEGDPELEMEKIKTKYESIDRKLLRVPSHEVRKAIKKSSLSLVDDSLIHKPKLLTVEYDLGEKGASIQDREEVFFQISGEDEDLDIIISDDISFELKKYFRKRSKSKDLGILSSYSNSSTHFLVHLPHVYFFILPMAIVDCEISFGKLDKAAEMLEEIIDYKFLNEEVEAVKIWMRLADIYLDLGDREYKQAGGDEEQYGEAAAYYEKLVKADGSLDDNSPLYKNARLAKIKKRVADFLNSDKPENSDDNPAILSRILEAKIKLTQIEHKLNYFGINEGYILPFSFEYLQNTARYFAQQASQLEQQYIQFKSTAENEELQYDRMDQQVALAEQTTLLEWRGFEEAMEGVRVAHKNESYANVQVWNAASTLQFFKAKKDELLEISEIEAWANASIGDQPRLRVENTSLGYIRPKLILKKGQWKNYWDEEVLERDDMIRILAHHRVSISHQFEQNKLENEELSSMAYREVTKAQLVQAIARQKVAQQRVTVANLQHRHAYENRQFLDLKEFGAGNWYEMSRQSRRLAQKYLDMATEISLLMEYAYNAETERGLKMIKHDYAATYNPKQLNSQQLLHDIDSFTYDMITNVRSKKSQVVKTISLADKHPTSFYNFKESGAIQFQTTLSGFEREFPGLYLCKIRNVEVSFTGVFSSTSISGTLRSNGVSSFRLENGEVISRMYPSDVMLLSEYDIRQDAVVFRFDPKELKLFENSGLETIWELKLPKDANDFDFKNILDIQLTIYYDGFFSPELESKIKEDLPKSGSGSKGVSMQLFFPDELYYLRHKGEGILVFEEGFFPHTQTNLNRTLTLMKLTGEPEVINNRAIKITSKALDLSISVQTDDKGEVSATQFSQFIEKDMFDTWIVELVSTESDPALKETEFEGVWDVILLFEYDFTYRA